MVGLEDSAHATRPGDKLSNLSGQVGKLSYTVATADGFSTSPSSAMA